MCEEEGKDDGGWDRQWCGGGACEIEGGGMAQEMVWWRVTEREGARAGNDLAV